MMRVLLTTVLGLGFALSVHAGTLQQDVRNTPHEGAALETPSAANLIAWAKAHPDHWLAADPIAAKVRGLTLSEAAEVVNREVNALITYQSENSPYGKSVDNWLSAKEATGKDGRMRGDCEEFAMLKIVILWKAGFNPKNFGFAFFGWSDGSTTHAAAFVDVDGSLEGRLILSNDVDRALPYFGFTSEFGNAYVFSLYSAADGSEAVCDVIKAKLDCVRL